MYEISILFFSHETGNVLMIINTKLIGKKYELSWNFGQFSVFCPLHGNEHLDGNKWQASNFPFWFIKCLSIF